MTLDEAKGLKPGDKFIVRVASSRYEPRGKTTPPVVGDIIPVTDEPGRILYYYDVLGYWVVHFDSANGRGLGGFPIDHIDVWSVGPATDAQPPCSCSITTLMATGCCCGAFQRERTVQP